MTPRGATVRVPVLPHLTANSRLSMDTTTPQPAYIEGQIIMTQPTSDPLDPPLALDVRVALLEKRLG